MIDSPIIPIFHFFIYIVSGISALLGFTTICVIAKQTPNTMRVYSRFLLLYLGLELIFTIFHGLGMAAVTILPVIGFFTTGFLGFLGFTGRSQLVSLTHRLFDA
ncbi:unnamed protein product, partial [Mesorhabditis belari]|uniref:NADH dehydrogenase subunit 4L n=1 Tax=Mesorhabditis belari TaxID=2138241 RepID=A0AAF3EMC4_9BILA